MLESRRSSTAWRLYHNLGGGGVDFLVVSKCRLRNRHYKGWVVLDMDGPRKGDDGFDAIEEFWISPSMTTS